MATKKGVVKRTAIEAFFSIRRTGIVSIRLQDNDDLAWVKPTLGHDQAIIITANGKAIRFKETDIRPMGRSAGGVRGIRLKPNDTVVGMEIVEAEGSVLVVTKNGCGKMTRLSEYPVQKRGGGGVLTAKATPKTGPIVATKLILNTKEGDLLLISTLGQVIRLPLKDIPTLGRATQGVRLMRLSPGDSLAALAYLN